MICEQETKTTCLFCEKERSLKPGCIKQRWHVCKDHLTVKCPVCGHFAFFLDTKYGQKGRYVCFRSTPWCDWTSETPPVETNTERHMKKKTGFTLIELLVVIAILGMLAAIIVPAVKKAREQVGRSNDSATRELPVKRFVISEREYLGNNRGVDVVIDSKTGREYLLFYNGGSVSACLRSEPEIESTLNQ